MTTRQTGRASISRLLPVLLGLLLGGCALPRGHREGYVVFGFKNVWGNMHVNVEPGSLADRIGVRAGERIVRINDTAVESEADLAKVSESLSPGDEVKINVATGFGENEDTATHEGVVTDADIGKSSNYLVYGYEKVGDTTKRRWLHLGLIAFGDWTGSMRNRGFRSRGLHVDVPPERVARAAAVMAYLLPKAFLFGLERADRVSALGVMLPTLYHGGSGEGSFTNASLLTLMTGGEGFGASLWPAAGCMLMGKEGGLVYLTPFNSVGWGDESVQGVTLAGVANYGTQCTSILPLFSYVDPKG